MLYFQKNETKNSLRELKGIHQREYSRRQGNNLQKLLVRPNFENYRLQQHKKQ